MPTMNKVDLLDCAAGHHHFDDAGECSVCGHQDEPDACDNRRKEYQGEGDFTFPNRDAAARAEWEIATAQAEAQARADGWEPAGGAYAGKVTRVAYPDEVPDFHFAGQDCVLADSWGSACIRDRNRLTLARSRAKAEGREG